MPYSKINPHDMILRDHLAYDRTVLASERTLLSYFRTGIVLCATGGTLIKIIPDEKSMAVLGFMLMLLGGIMGTAGVVRYFSVKKRLSRAYQELEG